MQPYLAKFSTAVFFSGACALLIIILDSKTTAKMMADNFFVVMGAPHGYMLSSF